MEKLYKTICIFMTLVLFCPTISLAAGAADPLSDLGDENSYTFTISEYEMYQQIQELSEEELAAAGYSAEQIDQMKNVSLEDVFLERSELSEEELAAYGYDDEQISLIKAYDGSPISEDSPMMAAISGLTCTLSGSVGSSTATVQLKWEWSSRPAYEYSDLAALVWKAVDSNGYTIGTQTSVAASAVVYRSTSTGNLVKSASVTPIYDDVDNGAYIEFDMYSTSYGSNAWAKSGTLGVTVSPQGSQSIYKISAKGYYGHSIVEVEWSISVSSSSLSISFTPVDGVSITQTSSATYSK